MHRYKIDINNGCNVKEPLVYSFSRTKGIELHLKKNKATIIFQMGVEKTQEQMMAFEVPVWKDAYRKVFLAHALMFDVNIEVKKISVSIDDKTVDYDSSTEGFPFIYSMISKTPMHLPESWRTKDFCQNAISKSKSTGNTDFAQISLLAFISSKGRGFEVDRFSNLWTSMNAYYNWFGDLYDSYFREKYLYDKDLCNKYLKKLTDSKEYLKLKKELKMLKDETPGSCTLVGNDAGCMRFLMQSMVPTSHKLKRDVFNQSDNRSFRYNIEQYIADLRPEQLSEVYEYALNLLKGQRIKSEDPYAKLAEESKKLDQKLYFFLVFEFPYYCRCNYLHGAKAQILLAYENEFEVKVLRNAGYFVERFLVERIPDMITGKTVLPEYLIQEKDKENEKSNKKTGCITRAENHKKKMEALLSGELF